MGNAERYCVPVLEISIEWVSIEYQPTMEDVVTMTSNLVQQVQEDMALIARGEEIDLPLAKASHSPRSRPG
jgi:hypothetical protein